MSIKNKVEVSVVSAIAGIGSLTLENFTVNSVDRCCASAALPPLPKTKISIKNNAKIDILPDIEKVRYLENKSSIKTKKRCE